MVNSIFSMEQTEAVEWPLCKYWKQEMFERRFVPLGKSVVYTPKRPVQGPEADTRNPTPNIDSHMDFIILSTSAIWT